MNHLSAMPTASRCCGCSTAKQNSSGARSEAKDLVCGMTVDPAATKFSAERDGATYFFCNPTCLAKFEAEPTKYVP